MNILVAGGRSFSDYTLMKQTLDGILHNIDGVHMISGGADGADSLAERYARENGYPIRTYKPDWIKFGKAAGPIRNAEMVKDSDMVVAFWDGISKGTKSTINLAEKSEKILKVIKY